MLDEKILSTIDQIHDSEGFAESAVTLKLIDCYEKALNVVTECDVDHLEDFGIFTTESFIQEGETWESIKDAGRKAKESAKGKEDESKLKRILLALPRLIITFINQLIKNLKLQLAKFTNEKKKKAVENARKISDFAHNSADKFDEVVEKYANKWRDQGIEISKRGVKLPTIPGDLIEKAVQEYQQMLDEIADGKEPKIRPHLQMMVELGRAFQFPAEFMGFNIPENAVKEAYEDVILDDADMFFYEATIIAKTGPLKDKLKGLPGFVKQQEVTWDQAPEVIEKSSDTEVKKYMKEFERIRKKADRLATAGLTAEEEKNRGAMMTVWAYINYINAGLSTAFWIMAGGMAAKTIGTIAIPVSLLIGVIAALTPMATGRKQLKAGRRAIAVSRQMEDYEDDDDED